MSVLSAESLYKDCTLCPRACHADRLNSAGFCGVGANLCVAKAMLHQWEEPCLSGKNGSGALFFSGCTLRCIYCQNYKISHDCFGREISEERLREIILGLEEQGAETIEFVTASQYIPTLAAVLAKMRNEIKVPTVFNCGGYESVESLRMLDGLIDIYLPDIKYYSDELAARYSKAPHYFETALKAVREMIRQVGAPSYALDAYNRAVENEISVGKDRLQNDTAILQKGVIIRHLVLPGCRQDSIRLLEKLAEEPGRDNFLISLMSQYTPFYKAKEIKELNRRVTSFEYDSVLDRARELGFNGFMQERGSAKEEYTPAFDLSGV